MKNQDNVSIHCKGAIDQSSYCLYANHTWRARGEDWHEFRNLMDSVVDAVIDDVRQFAKPIIEFRMFVIILVNIAAVLD